MIPEEGQNWNNPIWMDQKLQLIETGHLMKRMERELVHVLIGVNTAQNPVGHHTKHMVQQTQWHQRKWLNSSCNFCVILTSSLPHNNFWHLTGSSVFMQSLASQQEQFLEQHLPVLAGYTWAGSQPHTPQMHRAASVLLHFLVWQ